MHISALLVPFVFVASAWGLSISSPTAGTQIGETGTTLVSWSSVSTDPSNFELVCVDPTQKIRIVLAASVPTTSKSFTVQNTALSLGDNWTINAYSLPDSATGDKGGAILAQSGTFDVTVAGTSTTALTSTTVLPTTMSTVAMASTVMPSAATVTDATATGVATGTGTALNPTSGALGVFQISGTLMALVAVAHAFML
ncbi:hypothetical protein FRB96_001796 [Tulasnella sp. 330]|nr:hypothetical protein FRB96_001796 [Tulasnella sp. 330]KAG8884898.1 hypothetical protein FRB98_002096 [Tulasnella sp. 332]